MDDGLLYITIVGVSAALVFDFVNGFHDSANAIATVVGTRTLKPLHAVSIASIANFIGPFIFGTAVASTVGKGIIKPEFSTTEVILAGLIGAIVWNIITWYFGLP
ncbi:MAG TPA: inorganic phosphate transporter, partial [Phototrophicaceae bacterium]|nr:inorganic phosphate transporter [Phototrophicaceae bacterium]